MYIRNIVSLFFMLMLVVLQVGFVSSLPLYLSNLNIVLLVLVMILGFGNFRLAILWALLVGSIWDFYTYDIYGLNVFALLSSIFILNYLQENFLTNRSLYTFLSLTVVGTLVYEIVVFLVIDIKAILVGEGVAHSVNTLFWADEISKIVINLIATFFLFYLISYFSSKFKPMFLIK